MAWDFSTEPGFAAQLGRMGEAVRPAIGSLEAPGGQGVGRVELGPMRELLGSRSLAPDAFGCRAPGSGTSARETFAGLPDAVSSDA